MLHMSRRWSQWTVILFLCLIWYSVSSINNVIGKTLLNQFPYPMTVTMMQLTSIAIYSEPLLPFYVMGHKKVDSGIFKKIIIPLAIGKFIASVTAHISIWRVAVSYSHTVKATIPLFTVILTRVLFGEVHSSKVYCSLIPIVLGVIIASLTEFQFDTIGLVSALLSTAGLSLQHIFSKRVLKRTGIHQFQLLATLGRMSLLMFLPFWLVVDARRLIMIQPDVHDPVTVLWLLVTDGFLSFIQNVIAFSILNLVTPLTYAVASAAKRLAVIAVSILFLRNPVSFVNVVGMLMAVFGVFLYNRAKLGEGRGKGSLPTKAPAIQKSDTNFNYITGGINSV